MVLLEFVDVGGSMGVAVGVGPVDSLGVSSSM